MKAMLLERIAPIKNGSTPLTYTEVPLPIPSSSEILLKISACGVCHTELDEIEGRTPPPTLPIIPGHQVIGYVAGTGSHASKWKEGDRLGAAWIFSSCGKCAACQSGSENLCAHFQATGRDANGGYAEYMTINQDFVFSIPDAFTDTEAAPLLCAGAIGFRSLNLANPYDGMRLGLTGFGASGHLVLKLAKYRYPDSGVFVFARSREEQEFAVHLGADWAGDTEERSPEKLDAIIDTTPAWKPVVEALHNLAPGGRLVINAIRKEDADQSELLRLDYSNHLWMEKEIKSVANITRADVRSFLKTAAMIPIKPEVQEFRLEEANQALMELKIHKIRGAKVLSIT